MRSKEVKELLPPENHRLWNTFPHAKRFYEGMAERNIRSSLWIDLYTFFEEYVGFQRKKRYLYDKHGIKLGKNNEYNEEHLPTNSERFANTIEYFKGAGLKTTRVALEQRTAWTIEQWMEDVFVRPGDLLFWISPRGKVEEGYPGEQEENYIYLNVLEKRDDGTFLYHQLLDFHDVSQIQTILLELQKNKGALLFSSQAIEEVEKQGVLPIAERGNIFFDELPPGSTPTDNFSHLIVSTPLHLPKELNSVETVSEMVFTSSPDSEAVQEIREALPIVDEDLFAQLLTSTTSLLVEQITSVLQKEDNPTNPEVLEICDEMVTYTRQILLSWVEKYAKNYKNLDIPENTVVEITESIRKIFKLHTKALAEERLGKNSTNASKTSESRKKLNSALAGFALGNGGPMGKLLSVFHCVTGTPGSPASNNVIMRLTNGQVWRVPDNYLSGKGLHVGKFGEALGPCDVELRDDPYATLLSTGHPEQHEHHNFDNTHHSWDKYSDSPHASGDVETIGSFVAALI